MNNKYFSDVLVSTRISDIVLSYISFVVIVLVHPLQFKFCTSIAVLISGVCIPIRYPNW